MHARMKADLYGAGVTSPELLRHVIDHATQRANPSPRLTPSRRYRRWKVIAARVVVLAVLVSALYGVNAQTDAQRVVPQLKSEIGADHSTNYNGVSQ